MSQNKLKLTITRADVVSSYCVEMVDHHCNYCCVYEPTVKAAMNYAEAWFADADKREEANKIHGKAVQAALRWDLAADAASDASHIFAEPTEETKAV